VAKEKSVIRQRRSVATFGGAKRHYEVTERRANTIKLRRAGASAAEIFRRVPGYRDLKHVRAELRKIFAAMADADAKELMGVQFHRYEVLLRSIWKAAIAGDLEAHDRILKIMAGEEKLLGMGQRTLGEDDNSDVERWLSGMVGEMSEALAADIEEPEDEDY
jgi:hypothetical protein